MRWRRPVWFPSKVNYERQGDSVCAARQVRIRGEYCHGIGFADCGSRFSEVHLEGVARKTCDWV